MSLQEIQECIAVDGAMGEGGGQILRASLALSMALGKPFCMERIRARREKPGLKRQHLACVKACAQICQAKVEGDEMHSTSLSFAPGPVQAGCWHFAVGTGGSAMLVLQAVLPPLLFAGKPSSVAVEGGTHVPYAPPFEFMAESLFPWLWRMGARCQAKLVRAGYMHSGGGRVELAIEPCRAQRPFEALPFGDFEGASASIYGHGLPEGVLGREIGTLLARGEALGLARERICLHTGPCGAERSVPDGAGNMVLVSLAHGGLHTVFAECGWRGRSAEAVAGHACARALAYLKSGADAESCLADQLLVPLALAGGGSFTAQRLTSHAATCLKVLELFTGRRARVEKTKGRVAVSVPCAGKEE